MHDKDHLGESLRLREKVEEDRYFAELERLRRELRDHPFGYTVLALFVVAGPLLAPLIFPQAPPAVAVVGGLAFGAYAALCAVPQKFL